MNSEASFIFKLASGKAPAKQTLALHLLVSFVLFTAAAFCFVLFWFTNTSPGFKTAIPLLAVFGAICGLGAVAIYLLAIRAVRRQKSAGLLHLLELLLLGGGAIGFFVINWEVPAALFGILALVVLAALIFELRSPAQPQVSVGRQGIVRTTGLRRKTLDWAEIERVLLRRSVLTIDCLDNRLFQYNVVQGESANGIDFETFCAQHIEAAIPRRQKSDW